MKNINSLKIEKIELLSLNKEKDENRKKKRIKEERLTNDRGRIISITKYDIHGNIIYRKFHDGDAYKEEESKYNDRGQRIYYKTYKGIKRWEYDDRGNKIHYVSYDTDNTTIRSEEWWEYDDRDNMIHHQISDNQEEWWEYDDRNNMIHYRILDKRYKYNNYETWHKYDDENREIYYEDKSGRIIEWVYDDYGRLIVQNDNRDTSNQLFYDEDGDIIKILMKYDSCQTKEYEYYDKEDLES